MGKIWTNIQVSGEIGSAPRLCDIADELCYNTREPENDMGLLRINWQPSFEFPGGSKLNYLSIASPMIGGIRGADTLVSTTYFQWYGFPDEFHAYHRMSESSAQPTSPYYKIGALADQEYWSLYNDTAVFSGNLTISLDPIEQRPHKPLGLEISQTSRAWSDGSADRFIIVDMWIRNIASTVLRQSCISLNVTPLSVHFEKFRNFVDGANFAGMLREVPAGSDAANPGMDTVNVVWFANGSGEPDPVFTKFSPTSAAGVRILRAPGGPLNFNWWTATGQDAFMDTWGPRLSENAGDYAAAIAWPLGDRALYQIMTNGEIDYDQMYSAKDFTASGWERPHSDFDVARSLAAGKSGATLHLSYGPLPDLAPGDSIPFTYAIFVGENFHTQPNNYSSNFDPIDPTRYRNNLDFTDLIRTARAADWYFDNPGIDTDGDGYAGKFYLTNCRTGGISDCDTVWYKGDGVPDWGGAKPPPSPAIALTSQPERVTVRWTGAVSETSIDQLSRLRDFEGYRVYSSRTNSFNEYALIASWDTPDNYYRLAYHPLRGTWEQISYPQTTATWQRLLEDSEFDPSDYPHPSITNAYSDSVPDTIRDASGSIIGIGTRERLSYFAKQSANHGNSYPDGGETYQNLIQRVDVRDTIINEDTLQYGVYEITLDNLNPAISLWFTVTAFDYGDYKRDVEPLEGTPGSNAQFAFPQYSADVVVDSGLGVSVYPNPYKILYDDAQGNLTNYYAQGFEAYGKPKMDERERRIWFANLPDTADIAIYSLDGDLIRKIHHPDPYLTRYSSIVGWDLISRNTQAVVSGIYIWKVDSRLGSQVGKIVIIK